MAKVYENAAIYDAARDPVATIALAVECHPKQVASLTEFLLGVREKAGVYGVSIVTEPARSPEPVVEQASSAEEAPTTDQPAGEAHAEPVQHEAGGEPQAGDQGPGGEAPPERPEGPSDAGADGELAEPARKVGTGAVGGGEQSEGLSESTRNLVAMP